MKHRKRLFKLSDEVKLGPNEKYDIFISYRREGGADKARVLKTELEKRGFSVFLDFDELKDGYFDERITNAISSTPIFMILLSQNALDRCGEDGDWVCKEIEYAIKTNRHIIPINPDRAFNNFPISTPQYIVQGLQQHQMSEIMFGQLFNVSMDKMVAERIKPALARSTKRRLTRGLVISGMIALILIASAAVMLVLGDKEVAQDKQSPQTPADSVVIEHPTQQPIVEDTPAQTVKDEAPIVSKSPSASQGKESASPKDNPPMVSKPIVDKPVVDKTVVDKPVVDKKAIKAEIDKAFEHQFNLHRHKYPQGNNFQNMQEFQAYQNDINSFHQTLLQLIKEFKSKYNPDDNAEMLWIDSYCKDVMEEQYAQFNKYLADCANNKMNQELQQVEIHNLFVKEVFEVYQSAFKNHIESVVQSLVKERGEEAVLANLDVVMSNLKTTATETAQPQIDAIIAQYKERYPGSPDVYADLAKATLESIMQQAKESLARQQIKLQ